MAQPQALYRRWRPRQFGDVVGQDHVTRTLRNAVRLNRVAHGYLFCGPRGVAKTSTARILAKAINCLNSTTGEPCDECAMCISIATGNSYDVIEMDAASNGLVDNVRELRQNVMTHPDQARRKVYILDEAHRMSAPAFDALLKTLEEPPEHVVFILITSEPDKIPGTIVSRCQRFDFRRLAQRGIIGRLNEICAVESISIEPVAIEMIARAATGSMRDAQSLLDQLVALGGTTIEASDVAAVLGTAGAAASASLADHIIRKDIPGGLRLINQVVADGADPRQFCRDVTEYLRGLLLLKLGGPDESSNDSSELRARMAEIADAAQVEPLLRAVKLFGLADAGWRGTLHFQLPIELAFVEATLDLAPTHVATTQHQSAGAAPSGIRPIVAGPTRTQPLPRVPTVADTASTSMGSASSPASPPNRGIDVERQSIPNAVIVPTSSSFPSRTKTPDATVEIVALSETRPDPGVSVEQPPTNSLMEVQHPSYGQTLDAQEGLNRSVASSAGHGVDLQAHWGKLAQELSAISQRHRVLFPHAVRLRNVVGDRVVLEVRDRWTSEKLNEREMRNSVVDALTRVLGFTPRLDPVIARPNQWEEAGKDEPDAVAERVIREAAKFGWRGNIVPRDETRQPVE